MTNEDAPPEHVTTSSVTIDYEILRTLECDGSATHYHWQLAGVTDHDPECFDSELAASDDASETIRGWVRDTAAEV